jgi:hypothetical protein
LGKAPATVRPGAHAALEEVALASDARQQLVGVGRLQDADGAIAHALLQSAFRDQLADADLIRNV